MKNTYVLTGAHGTGKTTLIANLKELLVNQYFFSQSVTRTSGATINQKASDDDQRKILDAVLVYEKEHNIFNITSILDRSFIDFYAYTIYLYEQQRVTTNTLIQVRKEFLQRVPKYTTIFYLPIEFEVADDGVRNTDIAFQRKIDEIIRGLLTEYFADRYVTIQGTMQERVERMMYLIPHIEEMKTKTMMTKMHQSFADTTECFEDDNYCMIYQGQVISFLSYKITDRAKLSFLYTCPPFRGQNHANALFDHFIRATRGQIVYLYIRDEALPFYIKAGLEPFIVGASVYSGPILNYFATFFNSHDGSFQKIDLDDFSNTRIIQPS
jgi:hypothetical protein